MKKFGYFPEGWKKCRRIFSAGKQPTVDEETRMARFFLSKFTPFLMAGLAISSMMGCASTTEPAVRAYLHERQAYTEISHNRLDAAMVDLKLAIRDNPQDPSILNNMAFIEFKKNHLSKAVGYLEQARALRSDDNDEPYIMNEARILIAHHEYTRALALLTLIEPRHTWPKGYQKIMAQALLHNGQSAHALAILLDRHDLKPVHPNP